MILCVTKEILLVVRLMARCASFAFSWPTFLSSVLIIVDVT